MVAGATAVHESSSPGCFKGLFCGCMRQVMVAGATAVHESSSPGCWCQCETRLHMSQCHGMRYYGKVLSKTTFCFVMV
jgi:hypothetical protein